MTEQQPIALEDEDPAKKLEMLFRARMPTSTGGWAETETTERPGWSSWENFQPWSPPEDPERPRLPYFEGFTVQIHRHTPPPSDMRSFLSTEYLKGVTQSEAVVANPPLETPPPAQPETARLVVTAPIIIGAARRAQVVACDIIPDGGVQERKPFRANAKIYDSMYYSFSCKIGYDPNDICSHAELEYVNEAAVYEYLSKKGQTGPGALAPEYYGSWTFDIPITKNGKLQTRSVRLVLMECLQGTTMLKMNVRNNPNKDSWKDAYHYPEEYRLEIMARALDGYVKQLHAGINFNYFAVDNLLLVANNEPTAEADLIEGCFFIPRVVLINYQSTRHYEDTSERHPLPRNPLSFWGCDLQLCFEGWAPREWEDNKLPQKEWLIRRFYRDSHLYEPLSDDLLAEVEELVHAKEGKSKPSGVITAAPVLVEKVSTSSLTSSGCNPTPPGESSDEEGSSRVDTM